MDRRTVTPKDGEVILSVFKRPRSKQMSVHPRFIFPCQAVENGEVVITKGQLVGSTGVVKSKDQGKCVVTFLLDNETVDLTFEDSDVAYIEDL